jgi:hypothetical protein
MTVIFSIEIVEKWGQENCRITIDIGQENKKG